jgi:acyl-coenzyme A thioesterase PaaI-like protein
MDYFEPITSDEIVIESRVRKRRGRIAIVEVSFFDPADTLAAIGWLTMNVGDRPHSSGQNG